jgi:hypothetical protein
LALLGYLVLIAAACAALWALVGSGALTAEQFTGNGLVRQLATIPAVDVLVSAGGALAGMTMVAAFRHDVLPGALMALMLVPAAAMVGGAAAVGREDLVTAGLRHLLEERKLVERAKGAVTRYCGLSEDEAYRRLRKVATDGGKKMTEVARDVLAAAEVFARPAEDHHSNGRHPERNGRHSETGPLSEP